MILASESAFQLANLDESGGVVRKLTHVVSPTVALNAIMDVATDQMVRCPCPVQSAPSLCSPPPAPPAGVEQIKRFHESLHPGAGLGRASPCAGRCGTRRARPPRPTHPCAD